MFFHFNPVTLPPSTNTLREEVRTFLAEKLPNRLPVQRAESWDGFDAEFSREVGARGWIGMTWPKAYGGQERSFLERYVVLEEMLAAGAPVTAHWFADRQSGPLILRYGNDDQRRDLLPRMAAGELYFSVGMSEPDAGSDVAAVRTRARPVADGWILNGAKIWSTNAHRSNYMIALVRTSGEAEDRHAGLSQILIDLSSKGVTIRPIRDMAGREHFNEVFFKDVHLPKSAIIGKEGEGFKQVMAELAFERSGPERYLSSLQSLNQLIEAAKNGRDGERVMAAIGRAVAQIGVLRQMSLSVASRLQAGQSPNLEAALVKDFGTSFEQSLTEIVHDCLGVEADASGTSDLEQVHARLLQMSPCYSLRGGTREILRGIIARGLGLR